VDRADGGFAGDATTWFFPKKYVAPGRDGVI
jgi:hypothetical protein